MLEPLQSWTRALIEPVLTLVVVVVGLWYASKRFPKILAEEAAKERAKTGQALDELFEANERLYQAALQMPLGEWLVSERDDTKLMRVQVEHGVFVTIEEITLRHALPQPAGYAQRGSMIRVTNGDFSIAHTIVDYVADSSGLPQLVIGRSWVCDVRRDAEYCNMRVERLKAGWCRMP